MTTLHNIVLVVDDVRDWQITLRGLLTDAGFKVYIASSKEEALNLSRTENINLAVIDVRLDETVDDDISGVTLARELKAAYPTLKVILITGYENRSTIAAAFAEGENGQRVIEDFIPKTQTEYLIARVRELLLS